MLGSSSLETRAVSQVKGSVCFNRQRLKLEKELYRVEGGLWKNLVLTKKMNSRQLWTSWVVRGRQVLVQFQTCCNSSRTYFIYVSMHVGMDIEMSSYSITIQSNLEFEVPLNCIVYNPPIDEQLKNIEHLPNARHYS